jgi:hypothetical protein
VVGQQVRIRLDSDEYGLYTPGSQGCEFMAMQGLEMRRRRFGGDDPRNIVNRLTAGGANGIQIEQSLAARSGSWAAIADAVAEVYRRKLGRVPRPWQDGIRSSFGWVWNAVSRLVAKRPRRPQGG